MNVELNEFSSLSPSVLYWKSVDDANSSIVFGPKEGLLNL